MIGSLLAAFVVAAAPTTCSDKKWALVTGASSGIGEQISYELASRDYNVVLTSRSLSALRSVQAKIAEDHPFWLWDRGENEVQSRIGFIDPSYAPIGI